jgi:hypothetical protein
MVSERLSVFTGVVELKDLEAVIAKFKVEGADGKMADRVFCGVQSGESQRGDGTTRKWNRLDFNTYRPRTAPATQETKPEPDDEAL